MHPFANGPRVNEGRSKAEVMELLQQFVPTERELTQRRKFFSKLERLRGAIPARSGDGHTPPEVIGEDRDSR
jgi:hypothetical protein